MNPNEGSSLYQNWYISNLSTFDDSILSTFVALKESHVSNLPSSIYLDKINLEFKRLVQNKSLNNDSNLESNDLSSSLINFEKNRNIVFSQLLLHTYEQKKDDQNIFDSIKIDYGNGVYLFFYFINFSEHLTCEDYFALLRQSLHFSNIATTFDDANLQFDVLYCMLLSRFKLDDWSIYDGYIQRIVMHNMFKAKRNLIIRDLSLIFSKLNNHLIFLYITLNFVCDIKSPDFESLRTYLFKVINKDLSFDIVDIKSRINALVLKNEAQDFVSSSIGLYF